jgi:hypothetical protein
VNKHLKAEGIVYITDNLIGVTHSRRRPNLRSRGAPVDAQHTRGRCLGCCRESTRAAYRPHAAVGADAVSISRFRVDVR